jgi:hypothetical protein
MKGLQQVTGQGLICCSQVQRLFIHNGPKRVVSARAGGYFSRGGFGYRVLISILVAITLKT